MRKIESKMEDKKEKEKVVTEFESDDETLGSSSAEERRTLNPNVEGSNPSSPKCTIEFACHLEIDRLEPEGWIEKALEIIGHPEALITDWSTLWDFSPGVGDEQWYDELSEKFGFEVNKSDYIWRLAERLKHES